MVETTKELTRALGRSRGELNISILELSRQTGVSRWTLDKILSGERTITKLNNWLYKQI